MQDRQALLDKAASNPSGYVGNYEVCALHQPLLPDINCQLTFCVATCYS